MASCFPSHLLDKKGDILIFDHVLLSANLRHVALLLTILHNVEKLFFFFLKHLGITILCDYTTNARCCSNSLSLSHPFLLHAYRHSISLHTSKEESLKYEGNCRELVRIYTDGNGNTPNFTVSYRFLCLIPLLLLVKRRSATS